MQAVLAYTAEWLMPHTLGLTLNAERREKMDVETPKIMPVDATTKRHYMNLGAEIERAFIRTKIRSAISDLEHLLQELDEHVKLVSKRKGGLGRK